MSCDCGQCRQHFRTLGIAYGVPSESEIQDAYNEAVKQWHPDLYENYASLRADAEERFKEIQVAYRELKEHNGGAVEAPAEESFVPSVSYAPSAQSAQPAQPAATPVLSFGGALGTQTGPHFTPDVEELIAAHLGRLGKALAIVDLSGARQTGGYAQFLLLAELGMIARDQRKIVSLLWYKDLGEINLIDKQGKPGIWQSLAGVSGSQPKYALEIYRNNGVLFLTISAQADDSVKKIIYDFLLNRKSQI
jgi:hypothetical protein